MKSKNNSNNSSNLQNQSNEISDVNFRNSNQDSLSQKESTYHLKISRNTDNDEFKPHNYMDSFNTENSEVKDLEKPKDFIISYGGCSKFCSQFKILLWKNWLLFRKNIKNTLFLLLTPVLAILLVLLLQALVDSFNFQFINKNPKEILLGNLKNCKSYRLPKTDHDCITIGYEIKSKTLDIPDEAKEYYNDIMKYVAEANELEFGKDVSLVSFGKNANISNYLWNHKNLTSYAISFCYEGIDLFNTPISCNYDYIDGKLIHYTILANNTENNFASSLKLPITKGADILKLKMDLDNAIMKKEDQSKFLMKEKKSILYNFYNHPNSNDSKVFDAKTKFNISYSDFPTSTNRVFENADMVSAYGPFYFFFVAMINFVVILLEVVREKEKKLRKSLIIIGLETQPYWMSWILTCFIISLLTSLILCLTGLICQFAFFTNSNFPLLWFIFTIFFMSMLIGALMLSTFVSTINTAYTFAYSSIIIGLIMQSILTNLTLIQLLYSESIPSFVDIIKGLFRLYPPYTFSIIVAQISIKAAYTYDATQNLWRKGDGFFFGDLWPDFKGKVLQDNYDIPAPYINILYFFLNCAIFWILKWYFDHILDENQGKKFSYFFFLNKSFWFKSKKLNSEKIENVKVNSNLEENLVDTESERRNNREKFDDFYLDKENDEDESVENEFNNVIKSKSDKTLKILGLTKTYNLNKGCCKNRTIKALKPTYLEIAENEVFTIIGHNGAGKTTLINLLTGNIKPTNGSALLYGLNLLEDDVEQIIGLCPQHDILWDELTAEEHVIIYCYLRGINPIYIDKFIKHYLKSVNLDVQKNNEISTFSGGMKRRLSILLCTIGEPKVIFLDEPTTGLDPVNKRYIWKMVQSIKANRSIILTTHAMEEAEFLSDRIGVIKEGRFKSIGSSLMLKSKYGSGYLLTFIVDSNKLEESIKELEVHFPSGKVLGTQGGSIIMNLALEKVEEMKVFVKLLSKNHEIDNKYKKLRTLVKDCGMEFTTLEEIFLKVSLLFIKDYWKAFIRRNLG